MQQNASMRQLFNDMGFQIENMEINKPININGWEVQTINTETSELEWRDIKRIVRKQDAVHMKVTTQNFSLSCSPEHKIFVKKNDLDFGIYEEIAALQNISEHFKVLTKNGWQDFKIENLKENIEILDIEVEGTHSYLSSGILSHNTMYGDPVTTPGGMAIPYHASIRLKLTGGSKLEDKSGNIIGINVAAQTIKNKVSQPFRKIDFSIEFGKGIVEAESMFDLIREYCEKNGDIEIKNNLYLIEGTGAWKTLRISSKNTGEVIYEKKFNKSQFYDMINDKENGPYILDMLEKVMILDTNINIKLPVNEDEEVPHEE